jgi:D-glycero-D-manno-heptose 1,7-bisphosphate phosphatase
MTARAVQLVILDRDGVLNETPTAPASYILQPEEFRWLPGSLDACRRLAMAGLGLSVVTNQSAVGRGLLRAPVLAEIHRRMLAELAETGVTDVTVSVCPHHPADGCPCRKPEPQLLSEVCRTRGVPTDAAVMIGDHWTDLEAGHRCGTQTMFVRSGRGAEPRQPPTGYLSAFDDLAAATEHLLSAMAVPADD